MGENIRSSSPLSLIGTQQTPAQVTTWAGVFFGYHRPNRRPGQAGAAALASLALPCYSFGDKRAHTER